MSRKLPDFARCLTPVILSVVPWIGVGEIFHSLGSPRAHKFFSGIFMTSAHAETVQLFQSIGPIARLSLPLSESVRGQVESKGRSFQIRFPDVDEDVLGFSKTRFRSWVKELKSVQDERFRIIDVKIQETDGHKALEIRAEHRFPTGAAELMNAKNEVFIYFDQGNQRLHIDIWRSDRTLKSTAMEALSEKNAARSIASFDETLEKENQEKKNATDLIAEITNRASWCHDPQGDDLLVRLEMRPVHQRVQFEQYLPMNAPDRLFEYHIDEAIQGEEREMIERVLELYQASKPGLTIRAAEFLEEKYPHSSFRSQLSFLRGNVFLQILQPERAEQELMKVLTIDPNSKEAHIVAMFAAARAAMSDRHLDSLEKFLWLNRRYANHPLNWVFHLGAAEAFYAMKETDQAVKEYELVVQSAPDKLSKAEAAVRMGDAYLNRRQYSQALTSYFRASKAYPNASKTFASLALNRAEAFFWLEEREKAAQSFEQFLVDFPNHPWSWRAHYRLGEIGERAKVAKLREKAEIHYRNAINNFPFSPVATPARLALLACDARNQFTPGAIDRFFATDVPKFDPQGEILLDGWSDLVALVQSRTYLRMERYEQLLALIDSQNGQKLRDSTRVRLRELALSGIRSGILAHAKAKRYYEALQLYTRFAHLIPQNIPVVALDFYEWLGLSAQSLALNDLSAAIEKERASRSERARSIASLPQEDLHDHSIRLARARRWLESEGALKASEIQTELQRDDFSPEEIPIKQALLIRLSLAEKKKIPALDRLLLLRSLVKPSEQIFFSATAAEWLASEGRAKEAKDHLVQALESLPALDKDAQILRPLPEWIGKQFPGPTFVSDLWKHRALLAEELKSWPEMAKSYEVLVKWFPDDNRYRFKLAVAWERSSQGGKANELYRIVSESKVDDFWKVLAKEAYTQRSKEGSAQ